MTEETQCLSFESAVLMAFVFRILARAEKRMITAFRERFLTHSRKKMIAGYMNVIYKRIAFKLYRELGLRNDAVLKKAWHKRNKLRLSAGSVRHSLIMTIG